MFSIVTRNFPTSCSRFLNNSILATQETKISLLKKNFHTTSSSFKKTKLNQRKILEVKHPQPIKSFMWERSMTRYEPEMSETPEKTQSIASEVFKLIYKLVIGGSSVCGLWSGIIFAHDEIKPNDHLLIPTTILGGGLGAAAGAAAGAASPLLIPALILIKLHNDFNKNSSLERPSGRRHPWSPLKY